MTWGWLSRKVVEKVWYQFGSLESVRKSRKKGSGSVIQGGASAACVVAGSSLDGDLGGWSWAAPLGLGLPSLFLFWLLLEWVEAPHVPGVMQASREC